MTKEEFMILYLKVIRTVCPADQEFDNEFQMINGEPCTPFKKKCKKCGISENNFKWKQGLYSTNKTFMYWTTKNETI